MAIDTTTAACERLFTLMENEPGGRHKDYTEAIYDQMLAQYADAARAIWGAIGEHED